jgi:hypothetical protein
MRKRKREEGREEEMNGNPRNPHNPHNHPWSEEATQKRKGNRTTDCLLGAMRNGRKFHPTRSQL